MNNETEKILENHVWPPPPTFRPNLSKPTHLLPPFWVVLAINLGGGLLYSGHRAWHLWHTHQKIDWLGNVAFDGLWLFGLTTAFQIGLRHWLKRKTETQIS